MPIAWSWLPAWTHSGRVVSGHDVGSSHEWGRIEDLREPGSPSRWSRLNRSLPSPWSTQLKDTIPERWIQAECLTEEGRGYPSVIVPGRKA
jgi:hypothetical protein